MSHNTVTVTLSEEAYRKYRKIAKRQGLSDADLARICLQDTLGTLGVEIEPSGHSRHNDFSPQETKFIFKRYGKLGPTATAAELNRLYGHNRLPGTVRNKAKALGLV